MASWNAARGVKLRELKQDAAIGALFPAISFEFSEAEIARLTRGFSQFPGAIRAATARATEKARKAGASSLQASAAC